jgi:ketosteroid isomerase-like protein
MPLLSALVVLSMTFALSPPQAPPPAPPSAEDTVLHLEQSWAAALRHHDFAACDRLMSTAYFFTDGQGRRLRIASKTHWLDLARTYDVVDFTFDDARVRVYGDTAVVTLLATEHAKVAAVDRTIQYFITDIWRNEDGSWRMAERHSSRPNPAK